MPKKLYFNVHGMTCGSCENALYNLLDDHFKNHAPYQIDNHIVSFLDEILVVDVNDQYDDEIIKDDVIKAVIASGFDCEYLERDTGDTDSRHKNSRFHFVLSIFLGLSGILLGAAVLALMLSGFALPLYATYIIVFGCAVLTLALGAGSYWDAIKKLVMAKTITMDTLFSISTLTVIGVSIASLFVPWLGGCMIEAGLFIFGFRHIGKAIEKSLKRKVTSGSLFENRAAKSVKKYYRQNKSWQDCESKRLVPGSIIKIYPGQIIPVDGVCISKNASILKTSIDGSNDDTPLQRGEEILAGMEVPKGSKPIIMRVAKSVSKSYLASLRQACETAEHTKSAPIKNKADNILQYFIPAVLGIAILSGILVGIFFTPALALQCVAFLLVSACPCILGTIPSIAMKTGMKKAYDKYHVLFNSCEDIEEGSKVDVVVFDLNGTLTKGKPEVVSHEVYDNMDPDEFLAVLAAIEEGSQHVMGAAIRNYALRKNPDNDLVADEIKKVGSGIKARINDEEYLLGNETVLKENDIDPPDISHLNPAAQIIYLVRDGVVVGYVELEDPLREESHFVITELKKMNKEIHICTGNNEARAKYYAGLLGVSEGNICCDATPTEVDGRITKQAYITHLKEDGRRRVAMIGDAGNDSAAMTACNFGIAIKSHSSALETQENASAVVHKDSLIPVLSAFSIAKETVNNIKQNMIFSLLYNSAFILVAGGLLVGIGFMINPAIGAGLMVLQMSLILLNQYRISRKKISHQDKYNAERALQEFDKADIGGVNNTRDIALSLSRSGAKTDIAENSLLPPSKEANAKACSASSRKPSLFNSFKNHYEESKFSSFIKTSLLRSM
jgi:Cu2+-exporting ATPase